MSKVREIMPVGDMSHRYQVAFHSSMVGVNLQGANLRGYDLHGCNFTNANMRGAILSYANLSGAILIKADLSRAEMIQTNFTGADLTMCDLTMSYARAAVFYRAKMWNAYMRRMTHKNCLYMEADMRGADLAQSELIGSRFDGARLEGVQNAESAHYCWWISPFDTGKISFEPIPGWTKLDFSVTGGVSFQENAARQRTEDEAQGTWKLGQIGMWYD